MVRMDSQFITIVGGMKIAQASRQGTRKLRPSGDVIGNWGFIGLTVCICFRGVEKRYRDKDFVRNFLLINDSAKPGNFHPDVGVSFATLTIQGTRFNGPTFHPAHERNLEEI